jgi:hypothetical protein
MYRTILMSGERVVMGLTCEKEAQFCRKLEMCSWLRAAAAEEGKGHPEQLDLTT